MTREVRDVTAADLPDAETLEQLHEARLAEKRQSLYYRALASAAEDANDGELSERMNGLHADEQHHLSRLTVRLVEFGEAVADLGDEREPAVRLTDWEDEARERERSEIERYERLLDMRLDDSSRRMIEEFLVAERAHEETLGGKWMGA